MIFELTVFLWQTLSREGSKTSRLQAEILHRSNRLHGRVHFILNIYSLCNDQLSHEVRFRVNPDISDLHAADTRYYHCCKALSLHSKYVELLGSKASETLEVDIGLESVKKALRESKK